jgi:hypothetical protein
MRVHDAPAQALDERPRDACRDLDRPRYSPGMTASRPSVDEPVPALRLARIDGGPDVDLAALAGRRFLLFFWASW